MPIGNVIAAEPGPASPSHSTTKPDKRLESIAAVKDVLSIGAMAAGCILALSALVIWPISYYEGWRSDPLVTVMLVISLALISAGVHYRDVLEARSRK